ncbi:MAG TPA: hypothetical protein VN951_09060 [Pyrinomonadaceae bacterium]|nr:hypothetical protein [Pyrinomonadaceae bacterium]
MPLYTFVLNYYGGTYVRQIRASSPSVAPKVWAKKLKPKDIVGLGPKSHRQLIKDMTDPQDQDNGPTKVSGMKNTWCCTTILRNTLVLIHFVQTSE